MTMKQICGKCGKIIPPEADCSCSKRQVIYYSNQMDFTMDENGDIVCECGCKRFEMVTHINLKKSHTYNYKCKSCGKILGKESEKGDNEYY